MTGSERFVLLPALFGFAAWLSAGVGILAFGAWWGALIGGALMTLATCLVLWMVHPGGRRTRADL